MKHEITIAYSDILLRPVQENDLESLRTWRNDSMISQFLIKTDYITPEKQLEWFKKTTADTDSYLFAIEESKALNRIIGSLSVYNIRDDIVEYGRLMIGDDEAHGKGLGFMAVTSIVYYAFEKLKKSIVECNIHEENIPCLKVHYKVGFTVQGEVSDPDGGKELILRVEKESFYKKHDFLNSITIKESHNERGE